MHEEVEPVKFQTRVPGWLAESSCPAAAGAMTRILDRDQPRVARSFRDWLRLYDLTGHLLQLQFCQHAATKVSLHSP